MTAATWAASPYGSVVLGPAQRDVLAVVLRLTTHGRRPELTLGRLATLSGRPVSSVHDALGRLRALGILGVSARMGRHGGHRIWRASSRPLELDAGKHRRAVARILGRFRAALSQAARVDRLRSAGSPERPTVGARGAVARVGTPPDSDRSLRAPAGSPGEVEPVPPPRPDPFGVTPSDWRPTAGLTFRERLRREAERLELHPLVDLLKGWDK